MAGKPEATFKIGPCSASVFVNEVENDGTKRRFRSVNVQRSYKDGDVRKYKPSFGLDNLPQAIRVLQLAQQYVEQKEAEING